MLRHHPKVVSLQARIAVRREVLGDEKAVQVSLDGRSAVVWQRRGCANMKMSSGK